MSASPQPGAVAPGKRPFEEEQEQPDAKRQALEKASQGDKEKEAAEAQIEQGSASADTGPRTDDNAEAGMNGHEETAADAPDPGTLQAADANQTESSPQPIPTTGHDTTSTTPAQAGHHQRQDESQFLHVRAVISSTEAATAIGKGGENVSQIRRLSGAKCTVSDYSRGAVERVLTVSGMVDAVAKAFGLIIRTLNNEPLEQASTPQSKAYPLRLLVPHLLIGSIIGKGGGRIREIQDTSGARLNASDACLPLSTERSLVILGVADAVHIAVYYVGQTLVEQLTERFGGPASSAYANRHGQASGVGVGGLQVVPYVPQATGGQYGDPDTYRRHTNQAARTPANPYGVPYLHGQAPPPQQQQQQPVPHQPPQQSHAPMHYTAPQQHGAYAPAGPHQPHTPHAGQQPQPGLAGPPMQPQLPGQPISQIIYIPNDSVGAIIGKGGAKINEIRQLSGAVVKISEPDNQSSERMVTVTGTQECNQMALYLLYSRLDSDKARSRG